MPRLTDKQIMEKEPYRSIINLIKFTSHKGREERTGLTHSHIYNGLINEGASGDPYFYKYGQVKRGCIKKENKGVHQQLAEQFNLLKKRGFIERKGKPKYYQYYWTGKEVYLEHVEGVISRYRSYRREDMVSDFDFLRACRKTERFFLSSKGKIPSYFSLFGLSAKEINTFSEKEKEELFHWLLLIDDTLRKIQKKGSGGSLDFHWHI